MKQRFIILAVLVLTLPFVQLARAEEPAASPAAQVQEDNPLPVADIVWMADGTTCEVTLQCQYPPPSSVSCTSSVGDCHSTSTSVTCDGVTTSCSSGCGVSCAFRNGRVCFDQNATSLCDTGYGYCETCYCGFNNRWECG